MERKLEFLLLPFIIFLIFLIVCVSDKDTVYNSVGLFFIYVIHEYYIVYVYSVIVGMYNRPRVLRQSPRQDKQNPVRITENNVRRVICLHTHTLPPTC